MQDGATITYDIFQPDVPHEYGSLYASYGNFCFSCSHNKQNT